MLGRPKSKNAGATWGFFFVPRMTRDSGIFVTDKADYIFSEFFKVLADEQGAELPPLILKHPDNAINDYVRNYGLVAVLRDPEGTVICYSVNYRNRLPSGFTDRLRSYAQVMPDNTILWSDDVFKDPTEAPAREVIYGERPERRPAKKEPSAKPSSQLTPTQRAKAARTWHHPGELNKDEMDYLTGKSKEPPKP